MNPSQKLLCALLACLMLCTMLSACKSDRTDSVQTTSSSSESDTPTLLEQPIVLCDSAKSYYRVVRPVSTLSPINDATTKILEYPSTQKATNLVLRWGTDSGEATAAEILVGYTNRPESLEVMKSIGYDDFAIVQKNGKIVIAAHRPERLLEATDYLCSNLLQIQQDENGQKSLIYIGDYVYKSSLHNFLLESDEDLKEYVIVTKKNSEFLLAASESLQGCLKDAYGIELPIVDQAEAERECEILIGSLDRPISQKYCQGEKTSEQLSYVTAVEGKKLLLASHYDQLANHMVDNLCRTYVKPEYSYIFNVPNTLSEIGSPISFSETTDLAEGANLRVMSFNILCELWNAAAVIPKREIFVAAPILTYQPDILGLQEVSTAWYPSLEPLIGPTYAIVDRKDENGQTNFSPLAYNTETLTLLEHGVKNLYPGNNSLRVISWGYFERKSDGARFLAMNTHWNVNSDETARSVQATDMARFVVSMKEQYNCPVFTTGDYNTYVTDPQFSTYTSISGLADGAQTAKVVNRNVRTTHTLFGSIHNNGTPIDHVFASTDVEILFYNVLVDKCLSGASDHTPIYMDVKLN